MERGDWRRGMSLELLTCHEREDRVSVSVGSLTFLTPSPYEERGVVHSRVCD